jgi:glucose-1-phosphate cytidylyltransferase
MKAVLLAGGLGTRMREETEDRPKPMVEIGGQPILWHIMRNLSQFGITEFVIAAGYRRDFIESYFRNHSTWLPLDQISSERATFRGVSGVETGWQVTVAFTGETTGTGGRVFQVADLVAEDRFLVTYGDGLADVNVSALLAHHESLGVNATLTAVQPTSRFGLMDIESDGRVTRFREKPKMDDWVSIGYFVFEPSVITYLSSDCELEKDGLTELAHAGQLSAYKHEGFWQPMDTFREYKILSDLWESDQAGWKTWE